MAQIAGIQIEKKSKGVATHVRFDLKKYGETLNPILQRLGAISIENDNTNFETEWQLGITGDEVKNRVFKHLKTLPWKK